MPGHDVREGMAFYNVTEVSSVNGSKMSNRQVWGANYLITSAGAETRKVCEPSIPGQRMQMSMTVNGGNVVVSTTTGVFNGSSDNEITFSDVGDFVILESIQVSPTLVEWRIVASEGVTLGH